MVKKPKRRDNTQASDEFPKAQVEEADDVGGDYEFDDDLDDGDDLFDTSGKDDGADLLIVDDEEFDDDLDDDLFA